MSEEQKSEGIKTDICYVTEIQHFVSLVRNSIKSVTMPKKEAVERLKYCMKTYTPDFEFMLESIKSNKNYSIFWELLVEKYPQFHIELELEETKMPLFHKIVPVRIKLSQNRHLRKKQMFNLLYFVFKGDKKEKSKALGNIRFAINNQRDLFVFSFNNLLKNKIKYASKFLECYPHLQKVLEKKK